MTRAEHSRYVEQRKYSSAVWQAIHWLGSLHLAMTLLATIAVACAVATFIEAGFSTRIAQAYIYKAPWFSLWLGVLMVNLIAVTITRWPWQRRHVGFVITHYGIVILLIGAMIGQKFGFEGSVRLDQGQPRGRIIDREKIIQIGTLKGTAMHPFDPEVTQPSQERPRVMNLPDGAGRIVIDGAAEHLVEEARLVSAGGAAGAPGIALRLQSGRLEREMHAALILGERERFDLGGLAEVRLVEAFPAGEERREGKESSGSEVGDAETALVQETWVVLANAPDEPIVTRADGAASAGYALVLSMDNAGAPLLRLEKPGDLGGLSWRLHDLLGKGPVKLGAGGGTLEALEYWPALEIVDGKPVSRSDRAENPAAVIRLVVPELGGAKRVAGGVPAMEIVAQAADSTMEHPYRFMQGGREVARGSLKPGAIVATGWADWTVELLRSEPSAAVGQNWAPGDASALPERGRLPGIRALLLGSDGNPRGEPVWMPAGQNVFLGDGEHVVRAAFGHRIRPLPFGITLLKFEVPRDEGTDRPADFRSTVRFDEASSGRSVEALVRMNHPASFPPGVWGQLSGQTYKFSQAEWNPQNLRETTLQVLHDPGWLPKWVGSVMICLGIGVMFYLTPRNGKRNGTSADGKSGQAGSDTIEDRTPQSEHHQPAPASVRATIH